MDYLLLEVAVGENDDSVIPSSCGWGGVVLSVALTLLLLAAGGR